MPIHKIKTHNKASTKFHWYKIVVWLLVTLSVILFIYFSYAVKYFGGSIRDFIVHYTPTGEVVRLVVPDGYTENVAPGKGFTCTGLTFDPYTHTFWIANHGREHQADTRPFTPSLLNYDITQNKMLKEIPLNKVSASIANVQGVTFDTSDQTLWFVSKDEAKLYHIDQNGVTLGVLALPIGSNSVAYDSEHDDLLIFNTKTDTISRYDAASEGKQEDVVTIPNYKGSDQIAYDEVNRVIYITYGANGYPMHIRGYGISTRQISAPIHLETSVAAEGVYMDSKNKKLYVTSDEYFHATGTYENQIHVYDFDSERLIQSIQSDVR